MRQRFAEQVATAVQEELTASGVQQLSGLWSTFATIKSDGSAIMWSHLEYGGDSSQVREKLASDVQQSGDGNDPFQVSVGRRPAVGTNGPQNRSSPSGLNFGSESRGGDMSRLRERCLRAYAAYLLGATHYWLILQQFILPWLIPAAAQAP